MKTLGRRIIDLDPARGFSAESVSATVLYVTALGTRCTCLNYPSHHRRDSWGGRRNASPSVRWGVGVNILWAWGLTLPAAAALAALVYLLIKLVTAL